MFLRRKDIVCFEAGSGEAPWTCPVADLGTDWESLERLADQGVVDLALGDKVASVNGLDRVGLIVLPTGRRLIIRSKIQSLVLLEWLAYLGEFPPLDLWLPEAGVATGDDFHACIARLFLYELAKVTRLHLRKDYMPVFASGSTLRGRILTAQLSRRLHRLPQVPQRSRSRTLNTRYNVVLALALDRLPMLLAGSSPGDLRILTQLSDQWAHVSRATADPVSAATEVQWAAPPGYRAALQLARLVLIGVSLDPQTNMGGQAFTMSLALIWERSLRRIFEEISPVTGWLCRPDSERIRQWDDSAGWLDQTRWLAADVLVTQAGFRWVLDAKYKKAYGNESRADRFQMCAYAVGFDADRVSLVYPTANERPVSRTLLKATVGTKELEIDSIDLPMRDGPAACKESLLQVCSNCFSKMATL